MCKKSLLFVLLMALFAPWAAQAQTTVEIGDGTSATYYAPIGTLYNYSITEQLYTADEIGMPGTIQSISFNYAVSTAADFPIQVYMMNVEAADLSTGISLADADLVFDGILSVTEPGWATIRLDTPFVYDGTSNLLIGVNKDYFGWFSGSTWYYTSVANMTRYSQQDGSGYTIENVPGVSTSYRPNIQMEITAGSGPFCAKPTGVAVEYNGGDNATVTWNSDAASFNIDVNGTVVATGITTTSYPLTGLQLATTYTVKVQAVCGGDNGSSDWTNGTSFTTDFCMPEEQCNLTFVLTDTYGDGWNGNAIQLVDVATGAVVATLANQNLDGTNGEETQTIELAVCDGRELEFSWVSGSYVGEVQYTVTDINNEVVVEGSGASFETFYFTPNCTPVTCERPLDVTITYEGGTTAQVSWQAHAESYNIDVNGTVIEGITETEYELTDLELATTYTVMVQANCGEVDGLSNWTAPVSFMTDLCMPENMCEITVLTLDTYGDGWNGAAIQMYDYDTITDELTLLAEFTNTSEAGASEVESYTYNVCDGRYLVFFWSSGSYDSECQYAVYDNLGDPIFSGSGAMDDYELFWMNCNSTCRMPRNFAASEITGRSVMLSWTELGEATSWTLAYMPETDTVVSYIEDITTNPYLLEGLTPETKYYAMISPNCEDQYKWSDVITWTTDAACPKPVVTVDAAPTSAVVSWTGLADEYEFEWAEVPATEAKDPNIDGNWYYYDNGTYVGSVGLGGGEFHWGVMFPAGTYNGTLVSKVKAYDVNAMVGTLAIYNDGDAAPANQISIQDVEFTGANDWVEFTTNAIIDPTKNVWVVFDAVDGAAYPIGTSNDDNGDANGRWVEINGTWYDMANVGVTGRANMLRAYIESGIDPDELDWQHVSDATSPVTLSPLTPETQYIVRIKSLCGGEDGESEWTTVFFWTPSACTIPFDLEAEVEATSATLSWTGYQESYNVRYRRTPYDTETYFYENFDEGIPATWTTIDNDTTTVGNWIALSDINSVYTYYTSPLTGWAHSGDDAVASASYVNGIGAVATDNYLVTPQIEFNGMLRFYATSKYQDPDTYEVLLSTTGNTISDFNVTLQAMTGATYDAWDEVLIDLSDYAGQQGYIAIHHVATDKYWLVIDDFGMFDMVFEDWTNTTATENTLALTGLTPEAEYEWQVQGVNCSEGQNTEWSEINTFTTPEITTITQTIELVEGANWVSFYVETNLDDLKAALVDALGTNAAITIKSQSQNVKYQRGRWVGQLTALDMAQMYKISVSSACEISLEGMPIDPSTLTITINPGSTWIAFPYSESKTVAEFFNGFAINNDQVKSQFQNTKYNRGRWVGQLVNLEPGKGFIYVSADTDARTFAFPIFAKTAPKSVQPATTENTLNCKKTMTNKVDTISATQAPRKSAMEILLDLQKPLKNFNIKK